MKSRKRYWREILRVELRFWTRQRAIEAWIEQTDFFFILGMGRSGTAFLARTLDQAEKAHVVHEPLRVDFVAYRRAFHNPAEARRYLERFRRKEIYLRVAGKHEGVYGEVNSILRRHAAVLPKAFPGATLLHLIRDGRDVVRSMMARQTLLPDDPSTVGVRPQEDDPWARVWPEMDRFARLCWYWQAENKYLRQTIGEPAVHFERILDDYDYLRTLVLDPCGLTLPASVWRRAVEHPRNATSQHQLAPWQEWSRARYQTFCNICGEEMEKNGYDM